MTVPTPPRTPLVDPRNTDMASAWNGEEGEDWAAQADRFDATSACFDPPLLDGARIAATDRVLDVGCGAGSRPAQPLPGTRPGSTSRHHCWPRHAGAAWPRG